jgi:hypothetical protein
MAGCCENGQRRHRAVELPIINLMFITTHKTAYMGSDNNLLYTKLIYQSLI